MYQTVSPAATKRKSVTIFSLPQQKSLKTIVSDAKDTLLKQSIGCQAVNKRGFAVLFSGPGGTEKTLVAEIVAKELLTKLVIATFPKIRGRHAGKTKKNLARIFDTASKEGAILFLDEADALFGEPASAKNGHDPYTNQEMSYLFQRLESYNGLVILGASRKESLNTSLKRQMKYVLRIPSSSSKSAARLKRKRGDKKRNETA